MAGLTIGKFAAAHGVGVETVRFYQRRGLLPRPERRAGGGYREYTEADQGRLAFIRRARRLGFTLEEIADLLGPAEARSTDDIAAAAEAKLAAVDDQVRELCGCAAWCAGWSRCASTAAATTASHSIWARSRRRTAHGPSSPPHSQGNRGNNGR